MTSISCPGGTAPSERLSLARRHRRPAPSRPSFVASRYRRMRPARESRTSRSRRPAGAGWWPLPGDSCRRSWPGCACGRAQNFRLLVVGIGRRRKPSPYRSLGGVGVRRRHLHEVRRADAEVGIIDRPFSSANKAAAVGPRLWCADHFLSTDLVGSVSGSRATKAKRRRMAPSIARARRYRASCSSLTFDTFSTCPRMSPCPPAAWPSTSR